MKRRAAVAELGADVDLLGRATARRVAQPGLDGAADVVDALLAAQRDGS